MIIQEFMLTLQQLKSSLGLLVWLNPVFGQGFFMSKLYSLTVNTLEILNPKNSPPLLAMYGFRAIQ